MLPSVGLDSLWRDARSVVYVDSWPFLDFFAGPMMTSAGIKLYEEDLEETVRFCGNKQNVKGVYTKQVNVATPRYRVYCFTYCQRIAMNFDSVWNCSGFLTHD